MFTVKFGLSRQARVASHLAQRFSSGSIIVKIDEARDMTAAALKQIGWDDEGKF